MNRFVPAELLGPVIAKQLAESLVAEFGHAYPDWTVAAETEAIAQSSEQQQTYCLISDSGELLATAALLMDEGVLASEALSPWLGNLLVLPPHRNRGHGTQIVELLLQVAWSQGNNQVSVISESPVWFVNRGWRKKSQVYVNGVAFACLTMDRPQ